MSFYFQISFLFYSLVLSSCLFLPNYYAPFFVTTVPLQVSLECANSYAPKGALNHPSRFAPANLEPLRSALAGLSTPIL